MEKKKNKKVFKMFRKLGRRVQVALKLSKTTPGVLSCSFTAEFYLLVHATPPQPWVNQHPRWYDGNISW